MADLEAQVERLSAQTNSQVTPQTSTQPDTIAAITNVSVTSPTTSVLPQASPNHAHRSPPTTALARRNSSQVVDAPEMHTIVRSEVGFSIHGPTSAFRDLPSPASLGLTSTSNSPAQCTTYPTTTTEEARRKQVEQWKLEIFAYHASQLQMEHWYISQGKIDLDGVDPSLANHLLDLYWSHQYNTYLCSFRPAIMHSLATGGPYANKLLLNAIFHTGSVQSGRQDLMDEPCDPQTLGNRFFRRFEELLAPTIRTSSIPSISALIIMGSTLLTRGYQTLGWLYCGIAYRMISDLGFDINPAKVNTSSLLAKESAYFQSAVDAELQRRVFWGAYMNDRYNSLYFGRPPSLTLLRGFEPDRACLDTHDEMEMWKPSSDTLRPGVHISTPLYNVSNRDSLLKLADITSDIIDKFYTPGLEFQSAEAAWRLVHEVQRQLDQWADTLPSHLYYDPEKDPPIPPHRFYPQYATYASSIVISKLTSLCSTTYHTLHILLYRPFLPEGHLRAVQSSSTAFSEIRQRCVTAALKIYSLAQAYRTAFTLGRAPYLFSYAVFSAATVIPLLHWEDHHSRLSVIRFFLDALKEQQHGANFGLKKPIMIIRGMFERAGLDLGVPLRDGTGSGTQSRMDTDRPQSGDVDGSRLPGAEPNPDGFDAAMQSWESWGGEDYRMLFQDFLLENSKVWPGLEGSVVEEQPEMLFGMFG